jgi:hypothetical protein
MLAAMEALVLVAELNGSTMFARIGVMRALNRYVERVFDSSREETHWHGGSWRGIDDRCSERPANRARIKMEERFGSDCSFVVRCND